MHCCVVSNVLERTVLNASRSEEIVVFLAGRAICCYIFALGARELASGADTCDRDLVIHCAICSTGVFSCQDLARAIASGASRCVAGACCTISVTVEALLARLVVNLNSLLAHRGASPEYRVESHVAQTRSAVSCRA